MLKPSKDIISKAKGIAPGKERIYHIGIAEENPVTRTARPRKEPVHTENRRLSEESFP